MKKNLINKGCLIERGYIESQLDESCINQYFEIQDVKNGIAKLRHETGFKLHVPIQFLIIQ